MLHNSSNETDDQHSKKSKIEKIVELAKDHAAFFCDDDKRPFACTQVEKHQEVHAVGSMEFAYWLEGLVLDTFGFIVTPNQKIAACNTLSGFARQKGETRPVYIRAALHADKYYIDLGDPLWRVVEVDKFGWRIVDRSPVMFVRSVKMRPLPEPESDGKFRKILPLTNFPKKDWILVLAWIIECYRPDTPYVGLQLTGEAGSAKSSTQDILCSLIDPCKKNLRAKPKERGDIFALANFVHLLSYENLSSWSPEMQDTFCPILTGGAENATRELNTNSGLATVDIKKPVVFNCINPVVTAADLMDRFVTIEMPKISNQRLTQGELKAKWEADKSVAARQSR